MCGLARSSAIMDFAHGHRLGEGLRWQALCSARRRIRDRVIDLLLKIEMAGRPDTEGGVCCVLRTANETFKYVSIDERA
jgi:hypothetical protein